MPLDPVARKLLDEVAASGRPNAHLLPVAEARANFESLFAGLGAGRARRVVADHVDSRRGRRDPRALLPARRRRDGEPLAARRLLPRRRLAARLGRVPRRHLPRRSRMPRAPSCSTSATGSRRSRASRRPPTTRSPRRAGRTRTPRCSAPIPQRLAVAGDSAGGNLAAVVCQDLRDAGEPIVRFQLLVYPVTTADLTIGYDMAYEGYFLYRDELLWHQEHYLAAPADARSPRVSPLLGDASGLPPAAIQAAECDPLHPQAERYRDLLAAAGVPVAYRSYDGHDPRLLRPRQRLRRRGRGDGRRGLGAARRRWRRPRIRAEADRLEACRGITATTRSSSAPASPGSTSCTGCARLGLSVLVIDQATGVGGTWFWNRYPGARCDIESMTYSYSWSHELEQEWTWTERYAAQPEILRYLEHVADRFDLRRDIRARHARRRGGVRRERATAGRSTTDDGERLSAALPDHGDRLPLGAAHPRHPRPRALRRASCTTPASGRTRASTSPASASGVIGTGSSAVQAIPVIAEEAAQLTVFQRTANFSVPAWNAPLDAEAISERKARYGVFRRVARTTTAGNPWNAREQSVWDATPEEREREFEERYAVGGFCLHAAYSRPLLGSRRRTSWCASSCATRSASACTTPSSPSCSAPTTIRSARSGCASTPATSRRTTAPTCGSSRSARRRSTRSPRAACASATRSSRSTRSCSAPASTR